MKCPPFSALKSAQITKNINYLTFEYQIWGMISPMKSGNKNGTVTVRSNLSQKLQCGLSQRNNAWRTDLILFLAFHGFPFLKEGRETFINTFI